MNLFCFIALILSKKGLISIKGRHQIRHNAGALVELFENSIQPCPSLSMGNCLGRSIRGAFRNGKSLTVARAAIILHFQIENSNG
jgi:hypothetical protein